MNANPMIAALVASALAAGCLFVDAEPTLTILDQGSFPQFDAIQSSFQNQTGARLVKIEGGDAGTALKTALLGAGNPPADILFGVDNALFFTKGVREKRLFVPYTSPNIGRIDTEVIDLETFKVDGELWATPCEYGYISVNYDITLKDRTPSDELPTTLRDLATKPWASKFVVPDPRFSSPGLGFLLASIGTFPDGAPYDWKDYWRDLLNNGTKVAKDWTEAYVYYYTGGGHWDEKAPDGRNITVSYTTSPAAEVLFGTPTVPGVSLEPKRGVFPQVETMGILRGSKNVDLAKKFIDFMLTDEFQILNAPYNAVYPVVKDVVLPSEFVTSATDPHDLEPATFTPAVLRTNLDRWVTEWETLYQSETA
ncbi:MAG: thiamine ABC transporter substrate-binding protein [Euryarchaeota archaeon]|nr:thiamine ABC transporter substrate-binding protein [Euryarchaeota archaeon]